MTGLAASVRDLADRGQLTVALGTVHKEPGEPKHWAVEDGELLVSVLLDQHEVVVWALLGSIHSGGAGIYRIPAPGTEVLIANPSGEVEGDAIVVATLPTGQIPADLADDTLYIRDRRIVLGAHDAAEPLVLGASWKQLMEGLFDAIIQITVPTGVGPSGPPANAAQFTQLKAQLQNHLSEWVFTQKSAP